jgi:hypothetical protein
LFIFGAALVAASGCSDDGTQTSATTGASASTSVGSTQTSGDATTTTGPTTGPGTASASTSGDPTSDGTTAVDPSAGSTGSTGGGPGTSGSTDPGTSTGGSTGGGSTGGGSTGGGCGVCDQPNQQCINDVCVTSCQGQDPSPCPMGQVCDVISGECKAPDAPCTLAGGYETCGPQSCGPGTICDGVGECLPIAPCNSVLCTDDGHCWGDLCACERTIDCQEPTPDLMNGPFSVDIGGIDFADDCNAWMVTLRSGTDFVRRLTPAGVVTTWAGVANLNMGEVKVLRRLTIPQLKHALPIADHPTPPKPVEGLGEVAITYTCCPSCGCQVNPPQGVARLDEMNVMNPLPIIIVAKATQGTGPFGNTAADAGPQGLTWGEDRVLYVG